jgi:glycine hydroxymethyltransferase
MSSIEKRSSSLVQEDLEISNIISREAHRQEDQLELIASENFTTRAVLEAQGSVLTNKYAEGYPGARYYNGCEYVDEIENLAINRAKHLFDAGYANVQPHSGSQANQAVFLALLNPGDTILGLSLNDGGHLSHGASPNLSGKWFNAISYGVKAENGHIDYEDIEKKAMREKPRLIIAGLSAYPRQLDFQRFREIADKAGAYLLIDMAHIAGFAAAGMIDNPVKFADIVTTTTHKTLRGPRGGLILTDSSQIAKKINFALFPGLQGGPLMHVIAAKAVAFKQAASEEFKSYMWQVKKNSQIFAKTLIQRGIRVVTGGSDNHIVLADLSDLSVTGKLAAEKLENAGITCNKNTVPFDKRSPFVASGLRFGTPACTTRGFSEEEFKVTGHLIADIIEGLENKGDNISELEKRTNERVKAICKLFPLYDQSI